MKPQENERVDHDPQVRALRLSRRALLSCHATVLLYPTLSFLWTLPARLLPSFVARDGSNSFLINSSCQCNVGGDD